MKFVLSEKHLIMVLKVVSKLTILLLYKLLIKESAQVLRPDGTHTTYV